MNSQLDSIDRINSVDQTKQSRSDILQGSKSFSMASFFFAKEARVGAWQLYSWCRHCDDQIDCAENTQQAQSRLDQLKQHTWMAFSNHKMEGHPWSSFQQMVQKHSVPIQYANDLLRGMQWDVESSSIETEEDLVDYSYCVAGTVGLMMCHVMKLNNPKALHQAVSLGIALQLTNISRDLKEDFERGRIYLPRVWLKEQRMECQELLKISERPKLQVLSQRLLKLADRYYDSGMRGLSALSLRAAWAVVIATFIYRDIGHQVRRGGAEIFDRRVIVKTSRKCWLVVVASLYMIKLIPARLRKPWKSVQLGTIWTTKELFNEQNNRSSL